MPKKHVKISPKIVIKAIATLSYDSRHLILDRFEVRSDQGAEIHVYTAGENFDTGAKKESQRISINVSRLLFLLFLCTRGGKTKFPKSGEKCWSKIAEFMRKNGFVVREKHWVGPVFGETTLKDIFVDTRGKTHKQQRWLVVDTGKLDIELSQVLILEKESQRELDEARCLTIFHKVLGNDLSKEFKSKQQDILDTGYVSKLASGLQISGLSPKLNMVLGKTVWLSRLTFHREFLQLKFCNDHSIILRFERFIESFDPEYPGSVNGHDVESTWKELAAFHRYFKSEIYREILTKSGIKLKAFDDAVDELISVFASDKKQIDVPAIKKLLKKSRQVVDELVCQFNESIAKCSKNLGRLIETASPLFDTESL